MKILVTAGNTQVPIDRVRCITNIFTGRTGTRIAIEAQRRGHEVALLTSHPEIIDEIAGSSFKGASSWSAQPYRSFDELHALLEEAVKAGGFGAIIHSAAVSDFLVQGAYALTPDPESTWPLFSGRWLTPEGVPGCFQRLKEPKLKSHHGQLWLRLDAAPKLVDMIRRDWGFRGVLVKFKLEVGVDELELLKIAAAARTQSTAALLETDLGKLSREELLKRMELLELERFGNLMVANTLEGMDSWAYLGPIDGKYEKVERANLSTRLLEAVEECHRRFEGG